MADVIEFLESRSIQTSGGRGSGRRIFHVTGVTSVRDVWLLLGRAGTNGEVLPQKGDAFPGLKGLIAKDFSISLVAGHNDVWRVEWEYEVISRGFPTPANTTVAELPNEVGYVEVSSEIRAEFALAWRNGADYPTNGMVTDPDLDIGGNPIDQSGNPVSIQRNIQEMTITETLNVSEANPPEWATYRGFRFCRNSRPFLGADAGLVLYRGASVRRTGVDVYQVSHSFIEDSDYHLQQSPLLEAPDMTPKLDANGNAESVYWVQPFPVLKDFNLISDNF